jgi:hypothetical protein
VLAPSITRRLIGAHILGILAKLGLRDRTQIVIFRVRERGSSRPATSTSATRADPARAGERSTAA